MPLVVTATPPAASAASVGTSIKRLTVGFYLPVDADNPLTIDERIAYVLVEESTDPLFATVESQRTVPIAGQALSTNHFEEHFVVNDTALRYARVTPYSADNVSGGALSAGSTSVPQSGPLVGGSLDIPDTTSTASFHVDSSGNMWSGANTAAGYAAGKFYVDSAGNMHAQLGTVGGWTIGASTLVAGATTSTIMLDTANGIWAGNAAIGSAPFSVTPAGALTATNVTLQTGTSGNYVTMTTATGDRINFFNASGVPGSIATLATGLTITSPRPAFGLAPFSTPSITMTSQSGIGNYGLVDISAQLRVIGSPASVDNSLKLGGYSGTNADVAGAGSGLGVAGVSEFSSDLYVGGVLYGSNGWAAAPAVTFTSDPDTGAFRVSSNVLGFATGGTEIARMTSNSLIAQDGTQSSPSLPFRGIGYIGEANDVGFTAEVHGTSGATNRAGFFGRSAGGSSAGGLTASASGDMLVRFAGGGYTGSAFTTERASMRMLADEAWSGTAQGTRIGLFTTALGGTSMTEKLRLYGSGGLYVGHSGFTDPGADNLTVQGLLAAGAASFGTPSIATAALAAGVATTFVRPDHSHESFTVTRTSDSTAVNSGNTGATLTNDTTLQFAISSSNTEIWLVEAFLDYTAANATMDAKYGWSVPTACTMRWGSAGNGSSVTAGWTGDNTTVAPVAFIDQTGSLALGTGAVSGGHYLVAKVFGGGTAGNVVLQWAQNTSDPGNLKLLKGSFLRVTKLVA